MPSVANYYYEMPGYFVRLKATEPEPDGWLRRWGVNLAETALIEAGADPRIVDGELVLVPVEEQL